ncbi:hypothetical protein G6F32_017377 [Rhizopus arrhizus]|nr:hypothetical protein G6F32_017377 [Rhizopus arrhizus]
MPGQPAVGRQQHAAPLQAVHGRRQRIRRGQADALCLARGRTRQHAGIQIHRQRQGIATVGVQLARLGRDADRLGAVEHVA